MFEHMLQHIQFQFILFGL